VTPISINTIRALVYSAAFVLAMSAWTNTASSQDAIIFDGVEVQEGALPVEIRGHSLNLEVRIFHPKGDGPFPLIVINHGTPNNAAEARSMKLGFTRPALWFAQNGFLVVVTMRPGFGRSDGPYMEASEECVNRDYVKEGRQTAAVESAVVASASRLADADRSRILVVGHSAGGYGAIALADDPPPGVLGVISFAGGRGGDDNETICGGKLRLIEATRRLGKGNHLPQLWLYAENDHFFPPALGRRLFDAYKEGSTEAMTFVDLPLYGKDGHSAFEGADPSLWAASVTSFVSSVVTH
jgi:dienelactone hydrolase